MSGGRTDGRMAFKKRFSAFFEPSLFIKKDKTRIYPRFIQKDKTRI
jgi:hypothetical protein